MYGAQGRAAREAENSSPRKISLPGKLIFPENLSSFLQYVPLLIGRRVGCGKPQIFLG